MIVLRVKRYDAYSRVKYFYYKETKKVDGKDRRFWTDNINKAYTFPDNLGDPLNLWIRDCGLKNVTQERI